MSPGFKSMSNQPLSKIKSGCITCLGSSRTANPILKLRCPQRLWSLQECNETKDSINSEIMNILRDTCRSIIDDEGSTNIKWERGGNVDERTERVETKMRGEGAAYWEGSGYSLESHWQWKLLNCVQVQTSSTLCLSLEKCWWEAA